MGREYKKEYNRLTVRLLNEGYTVCNYPSYVKVGSGSFQGNDPLNNMSGGFEYLRVYAHSRVYKAGCGKFVLGKNVLDSMGFMGTEWCHENDNPVFRCPYDVSRCPHNNMDLRGCGCGVFCTCYPSNEVYDYENSIEKANDEHTKERNVKYEEFVKSHDGRVCRNHMFYDERTHLWHMEYNPVRCSSLCISQNGYCPILGKQLSKKRGNVYYDLKESGAVKKTDSQLSFFDTDRWERITKNIRFLKKPCSVDICEAIVKFRSDDIRHHFEINHSSEKLFDKSWSWDIFNIRAESKPSRDLVQDLQDLRDGVSIVYEDDMVKASKKRKEEGRKLRRQNSLKKLENKIIKYGYESLADYSLDKIHADKWIGKSRLLELEEIRQAKIQAEKNEPVQLALELVNYEQKGKTNEQI